MPHPSQFTDQSRNSSVRVSYCCFVTCAVFTAVCAVTIQVLWTPQSPILEHDSHPYWTEPQFLSDEQLIRLQRLFESKVGVFPAAKQDYTSVSEMHIGEAEKPLIVDINESNQTHYSCSKKYLIYNPSIHRCIFPNRIDIGRHFVLTGGYNGWKERYDTLVSRVHPFINYQFNVTKHDEFNELFKMPSFQEAVTKVCTHYSSPHFRPFQLSLILQIPGQSVPAHLDIPFFSVASRYLIPQWLLLVMQESRLFKHQRIPQVQSLVYVHNFNDDNKSQSDKGGKFVVWPFGPDHNAVEIGVPSKSAVFCDGSEMVHAAVTFQPRRRPLKLDKDRTSHLEFDNDEQKWRLFVDDLGTNHTWDWDSIRASIAFRGWCFADEKQAEEYDPFDRTGTMNVSEIIKVLMKDLVQRGRVSAKRAAELMDNRERSEESSDGRNYAYELGLLLLDEFMKFPLPKKSLFPYNYCLIDKVIPDWYSDLFRPLIDLFCD